MPRKTTAADILAPKIPSVSNQLHGYRVKAAWFCRHGRHEEAKAFCAKRGIEYPPFNNPLLLIPKEKTTPGNVVPLPSPLIKHVKKIRADVVAAIQNGDVPLPAAIEITEDATAPAMVEAVAPPSPPPEVVPPPEPPRGIPATVWSFPLNSKIVMIRLHTGEVARMWRRPGLIVGRSLQVELAQGSGGSSVYREVVAKH